MIDTGCGRARGFGFQTLVHGVGRGRLFSEAGPVVIKFCGVSKEAPPSGSFQQGARETPDSLQDAAWSVSRDTMGFHPPTCEAHPTGRRITIRMHHGRIFKTAGDGILIEFGQLFPQRNWSQKVTQPARRRCGFA
jgi:hypothetical protein